MCRKNLTVWVSDLSKWLSVGCHHRAFVAFARVSRSAVTRSLHATAASQLTSHYTDRKMTWCCAHCITSVIYTSS